MKKLIFILTATTLMFTLFAGCSNRVAISKIVEIPTNAAKIEVKHFSCSGEREFTIDKQEDIAQIANWISEMELTEKTFQDGEAPSDMAGGESYVLLFYNSDPTTELIYLDGGRNHYITVENAWYEVKNIDIPELLAVSPANKKALLDDLIPMVCVNGTLFLDTGKQSDIDARCGVMDGEITSSVHPSEKPTKESQSNFGAGFDYQFVDEYNLDVYMNGKWFRFQKEE